MGFVFKGSFLFLFSIFLVADLAHASPRKGSCNSFLQAVVVAGLGAFTFQNPAHSQDPEKTPQQTEQAEESFELKPGLVFGDTEWQKLKRRTDALPPFRAFNEITFELFQNPRRVELQNEFLQGTSAELILEELQSRWRMLSSEEKQLINDEAQEFYSAFILPDEDFSFSHPQYLHLIKFIFSNPGFHISRLLASRAFERGDVAVALYFMKLAERSDTYRMLFSEDKEAFVRQVEQMRQSLFPARTFSENSSEKISLNFALELERLNLQTGETAFDFRDFTKVPFALHVGSSIFVLFTENFPGARSDFFERRAFVEINFFTGRLIQYRLFQDRVDAPLGWLRSPVASEIRFRLGQSIWIFDFETRQFRSIPMYYSQSEVAPIPFDDLENIPGHPLSLLTTQRPVLEISRLIQGLMANDSDHPPSLNANLLSAYFTALGVLPPEEKRQKVGEIRRILFSEDENTPWAIGFVNLALHGDRRREEIWPLAISLLAEDSTSGDFETDWNDWVYEAFQRRLQPRTVEEVLRYTRGLAIGMGEFRAEKVQKKIVDDYLAERPDLPTSELAAFKDFYPTIEFNRLMYERFEREKASLSVTDFLTFATKYLAFSSYVSTDNEWYHANLTIRMIDEYVAIKKEILSLREVLQIWRSLGCSFARSFRDIDDVIEARFDLEKSGLSFEELWAASRIVGDLKINEEIFNRYNEKKEQLSPQEVHEHLRFVLGEDSGEWGRRETRRKIADSYITLRRNQINLNDFTLFASSLTPGFAREVGSELWDSKTEDLPIGSLHQLVGAIDVEKLNAYSYDRLLEQIENMGLEQFISYVNFYVFEDSQNGDEHGEWSYSNTRLKMVQFFLEKNTATLTFLQLARLGAIARSPELFALADSCFDNERERLTDTDLYYAKLVVAPQKVNREVYRRFLSRYRGMDLYEVLAFLSYVTIDDTEGEWNSRSIQYKMAQMFIEFRVDSLSLRALSHFSAYIPREEFHEIMARRTSSTTNPVFFEDIFESRSYFDGAFVNERLFHWVETRVSSFSPDTRGNVLDLVCETDDAEGSWSAEATREKLRRLFAGN